jgi:hypothetical protein
MISDKWITMTLAIAIIAFLLGVNISGVHLFEPTKALLGPDFISKALGGAIGVLIGVGFTYWLTKRKDAKTELKEKIEGYNKLMLELNNGLACMFNYWRDILYEHKDNKFPALCIRNSAPLSINKLNVGIENTGFMLSTSNGRSLAFRLSEVERAYSQSIFMITMINRSYQEQIMPHKALLEPFRNGDDEVRIDVKQLEEIMINEITYSVWKEVNANAANTIENIPDTVLRLLNVIDEAQTYLPEVIGVKESDSRLLRIDIKDLRKKIDEKIVINNHWGQL